MDARSSDEVTLESGGPRLQSDGRPQKETATCEATDTRGGHQVTTKARTAGEQLSTKDRQRLPVIPRGEEQARKGSPKAFRGRMALVAP